MNKSLDISLSRGSLLKFALPTMISYVFMSIYSTIDGIFVSNFVGTEALSAVNIVTPFLLVSLSIGTMLGTGGSALVSKKLGEGKLKEARENFTLLGIATFVLSAIISIIGAIFMKPILYGLGANDIIYNLCKEYMIPILIIVPFNLFGIVFQMFLISEGKPNISMVSSLIGGLINVVLDYLLIVRFNLGIQGAAIATGIGYCFPALVGLIFFARNKKGTLHFVCPKMDSKVILKSCSNGMSEMVSMLSSSIVIVAMNNIMIRLAGIDGVSSITIILYVQMLLSSIYLGYSLGISPLISFNFGKQDSGNLRKLYTFSIKIIAIVSIATFLLSIILVNPIIAIFSNNNQSVFKMASDGFKIFSISLLFMGQNIFASAMFTALNDGRTSAIISIFRTLIFLMVSLMIFPPLIGVTGVFITIPLAEILSIILSIFFFNKYKHRYKYGKEAKS